MSSRENLDLVQDVMQQMCAQFDAEGVKGEAIIHSIAAQKRDIASLSAMKNARSKKLIQTLQETAGRLRRHAVNPAIKSLQTKQELVRRDIADTARGITQIDSEIVESIATLDRLRSGVSQLAEAKQELQAHVQEQIEVAQAHARLYTDITAIAFDVGAGVAAGTAAAAVAAGAGATLGRPVTAAVSSSGAAGGDCDVVSGVVHMFNIGDIRPFSFSLAQSTTADVANALWDTMWEEQCARRRLNP